MMILGLTIDDDTYDPRIPEIIAQQIRYKGWSVRQVSFKDEAADEAQKLYGFTQYPSNYLGYYTTHVCSDLLPGGGLTQDKAVRFHRNMRRNEDGAYWLKNIADKLSDADLIIVDSVLFQEELDLLCNLRACRFLVRVKPQPYRTPFGQFPGNISDALDHRYDHVIRPDCDSDANTIAGEIISRISPMLRGVRPNTFEFIPYVPEVEP